MLRKLLSAFALGGALAAGAAAEPPPAPYGEPATDLVYNLLFADDWRALRGSAADEPGEPLATLLADEPDAARLLAIASDRARESRLRMLACHRLRELNRPVPPKELLGVVVEVGTEGGLDVLAAYPDGSVRYIGHSGKMVSADAPAPAVAARARELLAAARPVVERTGPWRGGRPAAPPEGVVRFTFLVCGGLHLGQGPYSRMRTDPMGGPLIAAAERLLVAVVRDVLQEQGTDAAHDTGPAR